MFEFCALFLEEYVKKKKLEEFKRVATKMMKGLPQHIGVK